VPFIIPKELPAAGDEGEHSLQYPVVFTLKNAPYTAWETIWRWVGGELKNTTNKAHIDKQASEILVFSTIFIYFFGTGVTTSTLSRTPVGTRSIVNTITSSKQSFFPVNAHVESIIRLLHLRIRCELSNKDHHLTADRYVRNGGRKQTLPLLRSQKTSMAPEMQ
jgi:hypothetical protein